MKPRNIFASHAEKRRAEMFHRTSGGTEMTNLDNYIPANPTDKVWSEYDSAAEYCAKRKPDQWRFCLPPNISLACMNEILYDQDAFEQRVKDCAYARAMNASEQVGEP